MWMKRGYRVSVDGKPSSAHTYTFMITSEVDEVGVLSWRRWCSKLSSEHTHALFSIKTCGWSGGIGWVWMVKPLPGILTHYFRSQRGGRSGSIVLVWMMFEILFPTYSQSIWDAKRRITWGYWVSVDSALSSLLRVLTPYCLCIRGGWSGSIG